MTRNSHRIQGRINPVQLLPCLLLGAFLLSPAALGQERWFKIEVTVFSNESEADRSEELWSPDASSLRYPKGMRRLSRISDLLMIERLRVEEESSEESRSLDGFEQRPFARPEILPSPTALRKQMQAQREAAIAAIGPAPATTADFKFFDLARDGFVLLPAAESNFLQTNRAIDRAPEHRLMFHGVWRQAVPDPESAIPLYVNGGISYGDQHELEGSISIRFNENRDRVVIDANLWLSEFSYFDYSENSWQLPKSPPPPANSVEAAIPNPLAEFEYYPVSVFHMQQSREMRSGEFHYLDHPAIGVVISVEPYELPELPLSEAEAAAELLLN